MKKIIDGKRYDTEKAIAVARWQNEYYHNDFRYREETLYKTKKGNYFLYGYGGPCSAYAVPSEGNWTKAGEKIIPLTSDKAYEWLEQHAPADIIEKEFPDRVEEA
jgi:hypothetical protein